MNTDFQKRLRTRVAKAAGEALADCGYVSAVNVFVGMGWLHPVHVADWRKGRIPYLEKVIQTNLSKISRAMALFRDWAVQFDLTPSETAYLVRTCGPKRHLRFSKSGDPHIERAWRTHFVSKRLSDAKQERLRERLSRPPELVVYSISKESQCSACNEGLPKGAFLLMEAAKPLCIACAGLDRMVFLPRGDATVTRRARKYSPLSAVVVRYSRCRKRYERQGILLEKEALEKACVELGVTCPEEE
jgi:hypothetical protein